MSDPAEISGAWTDAVEAMTLFAVDPNGTGISLRAPAGPVRDAWMAGLEAALPAGTRRRKMPATIGDAALLGGLDLAATLRAGKKIAQPGFLEQADGGVVVAIMAERLPAGTASILAAALDDGLLRTSPGPDGEGKRCRFGVLALDEGIEDERLCPALLDRLAFHLDLSAVSRHDISGAGPNPAAIAAARHMLGRVTLGDQALEALCTTAATLGAGFVRAPLLAIKAACAAAALAGREVATMEDAALAARLVLAPRATRLPAQEPDASDTQDQPDPPADSKPNDPDSDTATDMPPEGAEMLLEAAKAAIPAGLLAQLTGAEPFRPAKTGPGKAGARQKGGQRGRPAGVRAAAPGPGLRLNLIETLRAAAPWQRLRIAEKPGGTGRIRLRREDFRVTRTEQLARTTTIFLVDASGSSALNRLAEAKGAVELLLADCYQRRDQVAVLAFRGRAAQLLLPPTRSLVRAKRSLSSLPGGGGTPLAAGLEAGFLLAETVRRAGNTATLVLLTDGRANVTLAGTGGRAEADEEAALAARRLRAAGHRSLLVDISPRPNEQARRLAGEMGALYLPLPFASAAAVSGAVRAASGRP